MKLNQLPIPPETLRQAKIRLWPPAIILLVLMALGALNCLAIMVLPSPKIDASKMAPGETRSLEAGAEMAKVSGSPLALIIYIVAFVCNLASLRFEYRPMAIAGAIVSMVPCSPVFCLSLPVGAWCLVALQLRPVLDVFAARKAPPPQIVEAKIV